MKANVSAVAIALIASMPLACSGPPDAEAPPAASEPARTEAEALLAKAIAYHDPAGQWPMFVGAFDFEEVRPDGTTRDVAVELGVPSGRFSHRAAVAENEVFKQVSEDGCLALVNGAPPAESDIETYRLQCDQIERNRNYYLYLWGLPMKLRDPGTKVDPLVARTSFLGETVDGIRVTYDAEVGSDIWYFYFAPQTARMVGYRFYHDEDVGDGEYITLEDEVTVGNMRLPARRRWYVNADDRFLGEDVLIGARPLP